MNKLEKLALTFATTSIILIWILTIIFVIGNIYAEEFLPGVEGVNNVTWGNTEGYPDGYYKEGYPVDD